MKPSKQRKRKITEGLNDKESVITLEEADIISEWNSVRTAKEFTSDVDVARFLLSLYKDAQQSEARLCMQCGGPLTRCCQKCQERAGQESLMPTQAATRLSHGEPPAQPGQHSDISVGVQLLSQTLLSQADKQQSITSSSSSTSTDRKELIVTSLEADKQQSIAPSSSFSLADSKRTDDNQGQNRSHFLGVECQKAKSASSSSSAPLADSKQTANNEEKRNEPYISGVGCRKAKSEALVSEEAGMSDIDILLKRNSTRSGSPSTVQGVTPTLPAEEALSSEDVQHHSEAADSLMCPYCDLALGSTEHREHVRSHSVVFNPKKRVYKCDGCSLSVSTFDTFYRHVKGLRRDRECPDCHALLSFGCQVREHRSRHKKEQETFCPVCKQSFSGMRKRTFERHLRRHDSELEETMYVSLVTQRGDGSTKRTLVDSELQSAEGSPQKQARGGLVVVASTVVKPEEPPHIRVSDGDIDIKAELVLNNSGACNTTASVQAVEVVETMSDEHAGSESAELFWCPYCSLTVDYFHHREHIKTHRLLFNPQNEVYKCGACSATLSCYDTFYRHIATQLKDKECTDCQKLFSFGCQVRQHRKLHRKDVEYSVPGGQTETSSAELFLCPYCDSAVRQTGHRAHIRLHSDLFNPEKGVFKCHACSMTMPTYDAFYRHVAAELQNKECPECHDVLSFGCQVRQHKKQHKKEAEQKSDPDDVLLCPYCDVTVGYMEHRAHIRSHSDLFQPQEDTYKCHACSYTTPFYDSFYRHMMTLLKDQTCPDCHLVTTFGCQVRKHKKKHRKEQDRLCTVCDHSFPAMKKRDFQRHLKSHGLTVTRTDASAIENKKHPLFDLSAAAVVVECGSDIYACVSESEALLLMKNSAANNAVIQGVEVVETSGVEVMEALPGQHRKERKVPPPAQGGFRWPSAKSDALFLCPYCDVTVGFQEHKTHLKSHSALFNPEKDVYKCSACPSTVPYFESFYKHVATLLKDKQCPDCHALLSFGCQVRKHQKLHKKEGKRYCTICKESFPGMRTRDFVRHVKQHEIDARDLALTKSVNGSHGSRVERLTERAADGAVISSGVASSSGAGGPSLAERGAESAVDKATGSDPLQCFLCPYCTKVFSSMHQHKRHLKTHRIIYNANRSGYRCHVCAAKVLTFGSFYRHIATVLQDKHCPHCEEILTTGCQVRSHQQRHARELAKFCSVCNLAFPNMDKKAFGGHMAKHVAQGTATAAAAAQVSSPARSSRFGSKSSHPLRRRSEPRKTRKSTSQATNVPTTRAESHVRKVSATVRESQAANVPATTAETHVTKVSATVRESQGTHVSGTGTLAAKVSDTGSESQVINVSGTLSQETKAAGSGRESRVAVVSGSGTGSHVTAVSDTGTDSKVADVSHSGTESQVTNISGTGTECSAGDVTVVRDADVVSDTHSGEEPVDGDVSRKPATADFFLCPYCGLVGSRQAVRKHIGVHSYIYSPEKYVFSCHVCSTRLETFDAFYRHIALAVRDRQCGDCHALLTVGCQARKHKKQHQRERTRFCDVCNKSFAHMLSHVFATHMKSHQKENAASVVEGSSRPDDLVSESYQRVYVSGGESFSLAQESCNLVEEPSSLVHAAALATSASQREVQLVVEVIQRSSASTQQLALSTVAGEQGSHLDVERKETSFSAEDLAASGSGGATGETAKDGASTQGHPLTGDWREVVNVIESVETVSTTDHPLTDDWGDAVIENVRVLSAIGHPPANDWTEIVTERAEAVSTLGRQPAGDWKEIRIENVKVVSAIGQNPANDWKEIVIENVTDVSSMVRPPASDCKGTVMENKSTESTMGHPPTNGWKETVMESAEAGSALRPPQATDGSNRNSTASYDTQLFSADVKSTLPMKSAPAALRPVPALGGAANLLYCPYCHLALGAHEHKKHIKTHSKKFNQEENVFKCGACTSRTKDFDSFYRHMVTLARDKACQDCDTVLSFGCQVRDHAKKHQLEQTRFCSKCNMSFPTMRKRDFDTHMKKHSLEDTAASVTDIGVEVCASSDATVPATPADGKATSGLERLLKCPYCQAACRERAEHRRHIATHSIIFNSEKDVYTCPTCAKDLTSFEEFYQHVAKEEEEEATLVSEHKPDSQTQEHSYSKGQLSGTVPECATSKGQLSGAIQDQAESPDQLTPNHDTKKPPTTFKFRCSVCSQNFESKSSLTKHMADHARENFYHCPFPSCDKAFRSKRYLQQHEKVHQTNTFQCQVCDSKFSHKEMLTQHLQEHYGQRVKCQHCSHRFTSKAGLKAHMKAAHKKSAFS